MGDTTTGQNPGDDTQNQQPTGDGGDPPPAGGDDGSGGGDPPPADASTKPTGTQTTPKEPAVVQMPSSALKKLKAKERERGRKQMLREMNEQAKALGFASLEAMQKAAQGKAADSDQRGSKNRRGTAPEERDVADNTTPKNTGDDAGDTPNGGPDVTRLEKRNAALVEEKRKANRARAREEKKRRRLEKQLAAQEAETELKMAAMRAGITSPQHVRFALSELRTHLKGKTPDELKEFQEEDYFSKTLREQHPYLYGVKERDASTGPDSTQTGGDPAPKTPPPNGANGDDKGDGDDKTPVDARKMNRADYEKLLEKRGLQNPSAGF